MSIFSKKEELTKQFDMFFGWNRYSGRKEIVWKQNNNIPEGRPIDTSMLPLKDSGGLVIWSISIYTIDHPVTDGYYRMKSIWSQRTVAGWEPWALDELRYAPCLGTKSEKIAKRMMEEYEKYAKDHLYEEFDRLINSNYTTKNNCLPCMLKVNDIYEYI